MGAGPGEGVTLAGFVAARLDEGDAEAREAERLGYPRWRELQRSNRALRAHVAEHGPSPLIASTWDRHPDYLAWG